MLLKELEQINAHDIVLASKSPRRQQLMKGAGIRFRTMNNCDIEEVYPSVLQAEAIPQYLARCKAACYESVIRNDTILITADTIVWLDNNVIGKPSGAAEAKDMLSRLSGRMHEVFTGVCLRTLTQERLFYTSSRVFFRKLNKEEISFYVNTYEPFDKAGAYGVQEWIGYVGVERIEGSYFNVMGLPVQRLYCELLNIIDYEKKTGM